MTVEITNDGMKLFLNRGVNTDDNATYTPISKLWIGSNQVAASVSATDLTLPVPIQYNTVETLDDCETADWNTSTDAINETLNSSSQKEGTYSLNLGKSGTSTTGFNYNKTLTSQYDFTNKTLFMWLYIATVADLTSSGTAVELRAGSDSTNYYYKQYAASSLSSGWNLLYFTTATATGTTGSPTITAIDYLNIRFTTDLAADTITLGDLRMDYWHLVDSTDYPESFSTGYPTAPNDNLQIELRAEILDTEANGYVIDGVAWKNTDSTPITAVIAKTIAITKDSSEQLIYFSKLKARHTL